eukprot:1190676-Prorocentrum_minimum.AAC.1
MDAYTIVLLFVHVHTCEHRTTQLPERDFAWTSSALCTFPRGSSYRPTPPRPPTHRPIRHTPFCTLADRSLRGNTLALRIFKYGEAEVKWRAMHGDEGFINDDDEDLSFKEGDYDDYLVP